MDCRHGQALTACIAETKLLEASAAHGHPASSPEGPLGKPHKQLVGPGVWRRRVHHILVELKNGALCHAKQEADEAGDGR